VPKVSVAAILAEFAALVDDYARVDPSHHICSIGFTSSDLNGQGSTVTFWLARKSTVARAVCSPALS
jgi:hypothetical protein